MSATPVKATSTATGNTSNNALPAVDLAAMEGVFNAQLMRGVAYGLGCKPPTLGCAPGAFKRVDCSGEARYLLYQGTRGQLVLPDGSVNQRGWCERHGLHQVSYREVEAAEPGELFLCFITPHTNGCGSVGHVWLVRHFAEHGAWTMESHGGRGVASRPAKTPVLHRQVHKCFKLPVAGNGDGNQGLADGSGTASQRSSTTSTPAPDPHPPTPVKIAVNDLPPVAGLLYEGHLYPLLVEQAEAEGQRVTGVLRPQRAGEAWRVRIEKR